MKKANKNVNIVDLEPRFLEVLLEIEKELGYEIIITSGYRGADHPIEAKKPNGPGVHSLGLAADIASVGGTPTYDLVAAAIKVGVKRIGISRKSNFVHIDIADKVTSIWTY